MVEVGKIRRKPRHVLRCVTRTGHRTNAHVAHVTLRDGARKKWNKNLGCIRGESKQVVSEQASERRLVGE